MERAFNWFWDLLPDWFVDLLPDWFLDLEWIVRALCIMLIVGFLINVLQKIYSRIKNSYTESEEYVSNEDISEEEFSYQEEKWYKKFSKIPLWVFFLLGIGILQVVKYIDKQNNSDTNLYEEKERKEKEIYDKYINNRLSTGSQPYAYCFGKNPKCYPPEGYLECSGITVRSSTKSDIIVSIKKRNSDEVYKHAYIRAGESFTFNLPNGTYQPYFYYGKGWYPNKFMKNTDCGTLNGGFISQESVGTDKNPPYLKNQILEYELIEQMNGNFSTTPSNIGNAL